MTKETAASNKISQNYGDNCPPYPIHTRIENGLVKLHHHVISPHQPPLDMKSNCRSYHNISYALYVCKQSQNNSTTCIEIMII